MGFTSSWLLPYEGWRKGYLGQGAECSQAILQFVSVLHVLGVKAELVPLCQKRKMPSLQTSPSLCSSTFSLQPKGEAGHQGALSLPRG